METSRMRRAVIAYPEEMEERLHKFLQSEGAIVEKSWMSPVDPLNKKSSITKGTTVLVVGGKYRGQHMEVVSAATKTCVLKMGRIVTGNIKRQMLQTLEPALQSVSRCLDWSSLPVEVLCLIFNFLHELAYIARCRRVCTSWRDAVPYSSSNALRHIVMHVALMPCTAHGREGQGSVVDLCQVGGVGGECCNKRMILPTPKFIKAAVLRPTTMIIGAGYFYTSTHAMLSMRSLVPSAAAILSKLTMAVYITGACFKALAKMCTGLQALSVRVISLTLADVSDVNHQWQQLKELTLACKSVIGGFTEDVDIATIEVLGCLPQLDSFHLEAFTGSPTLFPLHSESLREVYVGGKGFSLGSINAPNLEVLDTASSYPHYFTECTLRFDLITNCPNLRLVQGFDVRLENDDPDPAALRSRAIASALAWCHLGTYGLGEHDCSVLWCREEPCNYPACRYRHRP